MTTKEKYKELGIKYSFYTVFFKRFLDILLSLLAIIILSPFLILFALLTLIFNGYPIFYKQARPGRNHKVFYIYKFRSMNNKKDKDGNLLPDSQRITAWGKIIRKLSIDELPQFFNILKGDMSFIGHRPKLVKDVIFYEKEVLDQYIMRPGITGYAAAYGRNKNTWEATFEKDKFYNQNVSLWLDIKIIFKTIGTIFTNKGESHSVAEEDRQPEREQEYYYADYLLRIEKISKEQYDKGLELSKQIIKEKKKMEFYPELLDAELFEKMKKEESIKEESQESAQIEVEDKNAKEIEKEEKTSKKSAKKDKK
ncbi:MAG: sugar transferase [Clostridia bacterium]|nr:sugar transferase [Clostridia bacterium]